MKTVSIRQRSIWLDPSSGTVKIIDQRQLPHVEVVVELNTVADVVRAIKEMRVRGAPLIGVTAAYGLYISAVTAARDKAAPGSLLRDAQLIRSARPTAVNLAWAVDRVLKVVTKHTDRAGQVQAARMEAEKIAAAEVENCRQIGRYGMELVAQISRKKKGAVVNILTHCNAGWLACVAYGTATAPIYAAHENGIAVHVWVDETRPLNQGSRLTAWELGRQGVPHTVIVDNAGGQLMQHGKVDLVITGTDRTTSTGDVANKIGTYLKALAAKDNQIPFYVALPSSTFDWTLRDGIKEIPIEERDPDEVRYVQGMDGGVIRRVLISPADSPAADYAFDVTPARLVTGFITERGVCRATEEDIRRLFPEKPL